MANISQIKLPNGNTYDLKDNNAAASDHTHSTSIATSSDTSQVTLDFGGKYSLNTGGTSYIFTMPADNSSLFIAAYGKSTYAEVLAAYQARKIVYCRASTSATTPGSGNQLRMAFLAYVNNETTPTEFEFQYYRSVSAHSASQQGDQVYVYKLNSSGTWSVIVREAYTKIIAGTGLTSSYASGAITISAGGGGTLPSVSTSDNGKILTVSSGEWAVSSLPIYDGTVQ